VSRNNHLVDIHQPHELGELGQDGLCVGAEHSAINVEQHVALQRDKGTLIRLTRTKAAAKLLHTGRRALTDGIKTHGALLEP
jgi:hypothetical protein